MGAVVSAWNGGGRLRPARAEVTGIGGHGEDALFGDVVLMVRDEDGDA